MPLLVRLEEVSKHSAGPRSGRPKKGEDYQYVETDLSNGQGKHTCDTIFSYFLLSIVKNVDLNAENLAIFREVMIVVCFFHMMLNSCGYQKLGLRGEGLEIEYCSNQMYGIGVFLGLIDHFANEIYPALFSNLIE